VKARAILEVNKLEITKSWLNRLLAQIDDLEALETFPAQDAIHASVELIEGLGACLENDGALAEFEPGGKYYQRAATLGILQKHKTGNIAPLSRSLDALEDAIWQKLEIGMRRQDREVLRLVRVLRTGLHRTMAAAAEAYHVQSSAELDRLAHTDPLTALHNRRYLMQELERHIEIYKRYRHPFGILMLDFDKLKLVNDTFGHSVGDEALKLLALVMKASVRDVDIPCRHGGDEFAVIMPETEKEAIQAVGHRISDSVSKTPLKIGRTALELQVSYGCASCPEDGVDSEALLQEADTSLYRTKEQKRKRQEEDDLSNL
jgi:diguanylate cyclase (GGDEF)-like protein